MRPWRLLRAPIKRALEPSRARWKKHFMEKISLYLIAAHNKLAQKLEWNLKKETEDWNRKEVGERKREISSIINFISIKKKIKKKSSIARRTAAKRDSSKWESQSNKLVEQCWKKKLLSLRASARAKPSSSKNIECRTVVASLLTIENRRKRKKREPPQHPTTTTTTSPNELAVRARARHCVGKNFSYQRKIMRRLFIPY